MSDYIKEVDFSVSSNSRINNVRAYIAYDKGGASIFSGKVIPRGYYFHLTPETLTHKAGYTTRAFILSSPGFSCLIKEVKRRSKKQDEEMLNKFDELVKKYVEPFCKKHEYKLN